MKQETKNLLKDTFQLGVINGKLTLVQMKKSQQVNLTKIPVAVYAVNKNGLLFMYSLKSDSFFILSKEEYIEAARRFVDKKLGVEDSVKKILFKGVEVYKYVKPPVEK